MGRAVGITDEQLRDLPVYKDSAAFSSLEKLVIEYALEMTKTPVEVPDEIFSSLHQHFSAPQLVELTATIAWENYRARFDHAFGIEAQGFSEGAYCPLPEAPQSQVSASKDMGGRSPRDVAPLLVVRCPLKQSAISIQPPGHQPSLLVLVDCCRLIADSYNGPRTTDN